MLESSLLFGGQYKWTASDWTSSDDRVRGGKSQSYLDVSDDGHTAIFHGNLDIKTLGGAGFASQRTIGDNWVYDLSSFDGIETVVTKSDGKRYTMIVKDEIPEKRPDGRDESNISWECDFGMDLPEGPNEHLIQFPWSSLKPFYRGKEVKDAEPLKISAIKRFSIMMRSHFGQQEGDFSLSLSSISAFKGTCSVNVGSRSRITPSETRSLSHDVEKGVSGTNFQRVQNHPTRHWKVVASLAIVFTVGAFAYMHGSEIQAAIVKMLSCQHPQHGH